MLPISNLPAGIRIAVAMAIMFSTPNLFAQTIAANGDAPASDSAVADSDTATAAEMLQRGIYQEETAGDLASAKKMYRRVVEQAKQSAKLAAEAQYRLGQCLRKEGDQDAAMTEFHTLIKDFPNQTDWVRKAEKMVGKSLTFLPAPYQSGQRETLIMTLAGGQVVGFIGVGAEAGKLDDTKVWRMYVRRMVNPTMNEGASAMVVDAATFKPIQTRFQHTLLGDSSAVWTEHELVIKSRDASGELQTKTVELTSDAFCNDQWFFGFRQLPLRIGYKATLPIRVAFTGGNEIGLEVRVEKKETIETPLGKFDSFRVDTNIGQVFWIADSPERQLVAFDGGGVLAKLSNLRADGAAEILKNEPHHFQVQLPHGWFSMPMPREQEGESDGFLMASTGMASSIVRVREQSTLDEAARSSAEAWMELRLKKAAGALKNFQSVGAIAPATIGNVSAYAATATFESGPYTMKRTTTFAFIGEKALEVHHTTIADEFEAAATDFQAITSSIQF